MSKCERPRINSEIWRKGGEGAAVNCYYLYHWTNNYIKLE